MYDKLMLIFSILQRVPDNRYLQTKHWLCSQDITLLIDIHREITLKDNAKQKRIK